MHCLVAVAVDKRCLIMELTMLPEQWWYGRPDSQSSAIASVSLFVSCCLAYRQRKSQYRRGRPARRTRASQTLWRKQISPPRQPLRQATRQAIPMRSQPPMRILRYAQHPYRRSLMNDQVGGYTMLQHTIHRATTYEAHDSPADNVARKMSQFETDRLVTGRNGESFVHAQPSTLTRHVDARRTRRTTEKNRRTQRPPAQTCARLGYGITGHGGREVRLAVVRDGCKRNRLISESALRNTLSHRASPMRVSRLSLTLSMTHCSNPPFA